MHCPRCRHENPPGMKFCGECGAPSEALCPSCQASNPSTNKFCGQCGATLGQVVASNFSSLQPSTPKHLAEKILTSKSALEGERKQVTVLFADMKGSMELLADRDPEEARKLLDPVLEHMIDAVHRYEGTVRTSRSIPAKGIENCPPPERQILGAARSDEFESVMAEPR